MSNTEETNQNVYRTNKEVITAFRLDCEEFLKEFQQMNSLKFKDFAALWRQRYFSFVFADQKHPLMLRDFQKYSYNIVKKLATSPENIYKQVGAFYMLYGLYYKQPVENWIKIRLTLDECGIIFKLSEELKTGDEFDMAFIFNKMLRDNCFLFVAFRSSIAPRENHMQTLKSEEGMFAMSAVQQTINQFKNLLHTNEVRQLTEINNEYQKLLKNYCEKAKMPSFQSTVVDDIQEACSNFQWEDPNEEDVRQKGKKGRNKRLRSDSGESDNTA